MTHRKSRDNLNLTLEDPVVLLFSDTSGNKNEDLTTDSISTGIANNYQNTQNVIIHSLELKKPDNGGYIIYSPSSKSTQQCNDNPQHKFQPQPTTFELFNLESLDTGDLLFFHADSPQAHIIEYSCNSYWCHIAMVVRCNAKQGHILDTNLTLPTSKTNTTTHNTIKKHKTHHSHHRQNQHDCDAFTKYQPNQTKLCLWECVNHNQQYHTLTDHNIRTGVQLLALEERLEYCTVFGVLKLNFVHNGGDGEQTRERLRKRIINVIRKYDNYPYEQYYINLFWAWWHSVAWINCMKNHTTRDVTSFFCSELIAQTMIDIGLIVDKSKIIGNNEEKQSNNDDEQSLLSSSDFTVSDFEQASELNNAHIDQKYYYSSLKVVRWNWW